MLSPQGLGHDLWAAEFWTGEAVRAFGFPPVRKEAGEPALPILFPSCFLTEPTLAHLSVCCPQLVCFQVRSE